MINLFAQLGAKNKTNGISQLLVEEGGNYAGVVHLHDLIKEGIL